VANWTGQRIDSKDAFVAGDEYIAWLERHGCDPRQKRLIASDALDVEQILSLHAYFTGEMHNGAAPEDFRTASDFLDSSRWTAKRRIRFSAGWGTLLTNDFRNCDPQDGDGFNPVSLVCKLSEVDGRPAVKLSDNYAKAMGDPQEAERYRRVFGVAGVSDAPVIA
jgi:nicotinate phosphoribosyltransferase